MADSKKINSLLNIKNSPVFIFFGFQDFVLAPKVTDKANIFYQHFGANVKYICHANTAHPIPTDLPPDDSILARKRVDPGHKKFPYISNSGALDTAGEVLNHIIPPVTKVDKLNPRLFEWD